MKELHFPISSTDLKAGLRSKIYDLNIRLTKQQEELDADLLNGSMIKKYLIETGGIPLGDGLKAMSPIPLLESIPEDEFRRIHGVCRAIFSLRIELDYLGTILLHLDKDKMHELSVEDMMRFGVVSNRPCV